MRIIGIGASLMLLLLVLLVAPNALWLARSTAVIDNQANVRLESVQILVDSSLTAVGGLSPGSRRLLVLPDRGDATLSVRFQTGEGVHDGCTEYVEGDMYHVIVTIEAGPVVRCETELPIVSRLLVLELMRTISP